MFLLAAAFALFAGINVSAFVCASTERAASSAEYNSLNSAILVDGLPARQVLLPSLRLGEALGFGGRDISAFQGRFLNFACVLYCRFVAVSAPLAYSYSKEYFIYTLEKMLC